MYSRKISASRGITAGSGTATSELRAIILDLLEELERDFPSITTAVYVDDVNLETKNGIDEAKFPAPPRSVPPKRAGAINLVRARQLANAALRTAAAIAGATNAVIRFFEARGMEVSETKSCVAASTPALSRMTAALIIKRKAPPIHQTKGRVAKMLGVGTVGGGRRTTKIYEKRADAFRKKMHKYKVLAANKFDVKAAVRATAMPAVGYGVETAGIADAPLTG